MDLLNEIARLERQISLFPNCKDSAYITLNFVVPLWKYHNLGKINVALNVIKIYLVSVPIELAGRPYFARNLQDETRKTRFLWVCINGFQEYQLKLYKLQITQEQNQQYLENDTGVLMRPNN